MSKHALITDDIFSIINYVNYYIYTTGEKNIHIYCSNSFILEKIYEQISHVRFAHFITREQLANGLVVNNGLGYTNIHFYVNGKIQKTDEQIIFIGNVNINIDNIILDFYNNKNIIGIFSVLNDYKNKLCITNSIKLNCVFNKIELVIKDIDVSNYMNVFFREIGYFIKYNKILIDKFIIDDKNIFFHWDQIKYFTTKYNISFNTLKNIVSLIKKTK